MNDYDSFFSRASSALRGSAIRKVGDLEVSQTDLISLAPGFPDPAVFAWDELREIAQSILTGSDPSVLQYGQTRGYRPLLEALSFMLARRGIRASLQETIVTTGSQQALDLCARVFVDPGDAVVVELPAYTGAMTAFGNAQARLVGVVQDAEGIDLEDLDRVVRRERAAGRRVALLYVVPNFQNPTGLLTSRERRIRLLEWAAQNRVLIVEDDPYGALYFEDRASSDETRPLKADDPDGLVVYLSSFSKTVAPAFRVAWIAGAAPFISKIEVAKQSADLCTGALDQRFVYEIWKSGVLERRLPTLRDCYQRKRMVMEQALRSELDGLVSWPAPKGGFFLWASFPDLVNTDALLTRAVGHGVLFVPGSAFYAERRGDNHARLSFSAPSHERIVAGIQRLAVAVREELTARGGALPAPHPASEGPPAPPPASTEAPSARHSAEARSARPAARTSVKKP
jgi:2-aminoadipate transaminase